MASNQNIFSKFLRSLAYPVTKYYSRIRQTLANIDLAANRIESQNAVLSLRLTEIEKSVNDLRFANLQLRQIIQLARLPQNVPVGNEPQLLPTVNENKNFDDTLKKIAELCPQNFSKWEKLLYVNEETYVHEPIGSCSLDGHREAQLFSLFIAPYLNGYVLDIGCGPQPVPSYLTHYPHNLICGLDPLDPITSHPFKYVKGFSEYLPWQDNSFNSVIIATSFDHVLVPEQCTKEIHRVLKANGKLLIWVSFVDSTKAYDAFDPSLQPIDKFHLFHFNKDYFRKVTEPFFTIDEEFAVNSTSHFYVLTKK
ncbi:MAG: class I SAM-dependent methyltransferase [Pseudobdellovibrio sp.]